MEVAPQIDDSLNSIARALDDENMSYLNMLVDEKDYLPSEVAEDWLREQVLLSKNRLVSPIC